MTKDHSIKPGIEHRLAWRIHHFFNNQKTATFRVPVLAYWKAGRLLSLLKRKYPATHQWLLEELQLISPGYQYLQKRKLELAICLYRCWPDQKLLSLQLSWSHYILLLKIKDAKIRQFYFDEAISHHWSSKELKRQIDSRYFERNTSPAEFLKPHYVLEFTELPGTFTESELEQQLLDKIQQTLLEMGQGFSFIARQKRVATPSGKVFYIDLVFYHAPTRAYVLLDLKRGSLSYHDLGQMDVYLRLFDQLVKSADQNPSFGLILCRDYEKSLLQYSLVADSQQLKVATYTLELPR